MDWQAGQGGGGLYAGVAGDPVAIHEQADAMARAVREGWQAIGDFDRARVVALAAWTGPAAEAFDGWCSRARARAVRLLDVKAEAVPVYRNYADELARAQKDYAAARGGRLGGASPSARHRGGLGGAGCRTP